MLALYKAIIAISAFFALEYFSSYGILSSLTGKERPSHRIDFTIEESSKKLGLHFVHKAWPMKGNASPWLSTMGANLAVVDYDNDGWYDVFLGNSGARSSDKLFKNNEGQSFTDVTEEAGLDTSELNMGTHRGIFFDCNNDGYKDFFATTTHCPRLFVNRSGKFSDHTKASGIDKCFPSFASNVVDYNGDGLLDLVLASYQPYVPDNIVSSQKKGFVQLYKNTGKCQFNDVSYLLGSDHPYSVAIGVADLDNSGRSDIWFATDFGIDRVFLSDKNKQFRNVSKQKKGSFSRHGMSTEVAYLGENDNPFVFVSHVSEPKKAIEGNALWLMGEDGNFRNHARELGVESCGFAWGSKFFDIDNDSDLDLLVVNGFISDGQKLEKDYAYKFGALVNASRSFLQDQDNWPNMKGYSLFGHEKPCLFLNREGTFTDITELTSLEKNLSDGRAIGIIDLENDGRLSFFVANQKGELNFYQVTHKSKNNWIGFQLEGRCSNRDAFGAKIHLQTERRVFKKELQPLNGAFSQSDDRVHFGLADIKNIKNVKVLWPSGHVEILRDVQMNTYNSIKEGALCEKSHKAL